MIVPCFRFLLGLAVLFPATLRAQSERLTPLTSEPRNPVAEPVSRASINGLFIYEPDTISVPFIDDFSTDKFKKYNAQPGDANVSSSVFIMLYDQPGTTPLVDTACFMLDSTYHITYDSVNTDSLAITYVALPSQIITVYDSTQWPLTAMQVEVWPPYNIQHTVWDGITDTLHEPFPDICQDSVTVYFVTPTEFDSRWIDNFAYLNDRYPIDPPTVGVATLDPLDENGFPYEFNALGIYGEADFLTSKPIFLGQALDSVYLSFQYQPEGLGNQPEGEDSLVLEFWAPDSSEWYHVWSTPGADVHDFKHVQVKIEEPMYLKDGFQFRLRNYATLSGSLDHWHVDYVYLNHQRTYDDTVMKDFAFRYPSHGLLATYTAMPWKHFKWNPASYMKNTLAIPAYNGSNDPKFIGPGRMQVLFNGAVTHDFPYVITSPNVGAFTPISMDYAVSDAPNSFVYDVLADDTTATFETIHALSTTTMPELLTTNDTVRYQQEFSNYYAYDDGTAEAAYGPYGIGARLAYKFEVAQPDTLRSVLIHFVPTVLDASQKTFWLTVWADNGGQPGAIIHQSDDLPYHKPIYLDGPNTFGEYFFDNDLPLVSGTYYVGWQQQDDEVLNVGFDRNINTSSRIFYNVSNLWQNTSFQGSLMIRPVFVSENDQLAAVSESDAQELRVFPNPASNQLTIVAASPIEQIVISDLWGRIVLVNTQMPATVQLDIAALSAGVYVATVEHANGTRTAVRFVKE
jgi:hypothetical protein